MGRTSPAPSEDKPHRSPRNKMSMGQGLADEQLAGSTSTGAPPGLMESWLVRSPRAPSPDPPSPRASSISPKATCAKGDPPTALLSEEASESRWTKDVHLHQDLVQHMQGSLQKLLQDHLCEVRGLLREELAGAHVEERLPAFEAKLSSSEARIAERSASTDGFRRSSQRKSTRDSKSFANVTHQKSLESNPELADVPVEPDLPVATSLADALGQICPSFGKTALCIQNRLSVFGKRAAPAWDDPISRFVDSATFKLLIYSVIFLNVAFMVYSANEEVARHMTGPSDFVTTTENVFVVMYSVELLLRLWRYGVYFWIDPDWKWNWLDAFLLAISYYLILVDGALPNVSWLRMLRLLKLTKVLRVFRVVTMFKTLRAILVSLVSTMSTLFWSMVMLYMIIFMFARTFTLIVGNWLGEQGQDLDDAVAESVVKHFRTVNQSAVSLYMCITGGNDWSIYYDALSLTGDMGPFMLLLFVFFTQVAVMNIILGMFVNQAIDNMKATREEAAKEHAEEMRRRDKDLCDIIRSADIKGDGLISIEEWRATMKKGNVASYLDICGFRPSDVQYYYKMLYKESPDGKVNMEDFLQGCLALRGGASRFDIHMVSCELKELSDQVRLLVRE